MLTALTPHFSQPNCMRQVDDVTLSVDGLSDYNAVLMWNLHPDSAIKLCDFGLACPKIETCICVRKGMDRLVLEANGCVCSQ
jgi:hypothetical protein